MVNNPCEKLLKHYFYLFIIFSYKLSLNKLLTIDLRESVSISLFSIHKRRVIDCLCLMILNSMFGKRQPHLSVSIILWCFWRRIRKLKMRRRRRKKIEKGFILFLFLFNCSFYSQYYHAFIYV